MEQKTKKLEFNDGLKKGIPICLGYLSVSFSFGIMGVNLGINPWLCVLMSFITLTSAGQVAGIELIAASAGAVELILTTVVINIRYMLMSLSLSQKISHKVTTPQRLLFGFGITDEVFAVASSEDKRITAPYMYGLISTPVLGWTLGTFLGAFISTLLPASLSAVLNIALYAMFIAIIIPPAKKSKPLVFCIAVSVALSVVMKYVSLFDFISDGFRLIIIAVVVSALTAMIFPHKEVINETDC